MKRSIVIGMALMFAVAVAGFGVAADKEMQGMNHESAKVCANVNCCGTPEKAKGAATKAGEQTSTSWEEQLKAGADGPTIIK